MVLLFSQKTRLNGDRGRQHVVFIHGASFSSILVVFFPGVIGCVTVEPLPVPASTALVVAASVIEHVSPTFRLWSVMASCNSKHIN